MLHRDGREHDVTGLKPVDDIDAACAFLRERGVTLLERIAVDDRPAAGLRANYFLDPWGNHIELVEYRGRV